MKSESKNVSNLKSIAWFLVSVFGCQVYAHNSVDITNQVMDSTSPDCAEYVGHYVSAIKDVTTDRVLSGSVKISATDDECRFGTNQIPNHDSGKNSNFRGSIEPNSAMLAITRRPKLGDVPTALGMGANVILLNGIKWEAYPAACFGVGRAPLGKEKIGCSPRQIKNPWRYNVGSALNDFGFDVYHAHLQRGGLYHYHATPSVLYETDCEGIAESPVIGFAADGFAIYGPCFKSADGVIRSAQSSYQLRQGLRQDVEGYVTPYVAGDVASEEYNGQFIGDHEFVEGSGDLDQCNGMHYGYRLTDTFPYVLGCYSGRPNQSFR